MSQPRTLRRSGERAPSGSRAASSLALAALLGLSLTGCVSYDDIAAAATPRPVGDLAAQESLPATGGQWPRQAWWQRFGDPQLDTLVEEALAGAPELDIAAARLRAASAASQVAGAARKPGYTGSFNSEYQRFTENGIIPPPYGGMRESNNDLTASLSYDLDLWGRNRAALEAALSREHAAQAERAEAELVLATAVAASYIDLAHQYALLDVAQHTLEQREAIYALTAKRVDAGLDTKVELKQAESELPAARGAIAALHASINARRFALAALIGAGPDRGLKIARPQLATSDPAQLALPAAVPAELLGRRPDIVAARWQVEAAGSDIDVARAEFYPNINLTAFAGLSSIGLDNLLEQGSRVYGVGPAITLPLFAHNTLRGNLKQRYAGYDQAVAGYNRTLTDALQEVAVNIDAAHWLVEQQTQQRAALDTAEEAYRLATERYRAGLGNYLSVLQAQTAVLDRQRAGAALDARAMELRIDLIRALGGGFDEAALANAGTDAAKASAEASKGVDNDNAAS